MGSHQKPAYVPRISLQLTHRKTPLFQAVKSIVLVFIPVRLLAYHIYIVLRPCHSSKIGLIRCLSFLIDHSPPVRHHEPVKLPFSPQDRGIQVIAPGSPQAVYRTIGGHDAVPIPFLHRNLKPF